MQTTISIGTRFGAALVLAASMALAHGAAAVLDQGAPIAAPLQSAGIYPTQWAAQTFTTGVAGRLDAIELVLYGGEANSSVTLEVRTFGLVGSTAQCPIGCLAIDFSSAGLRASQVVPGPAVPSFGITDQWTRVDLADSKLAAAVGEQFAIVLSTRTASNINWRNTNDPNGFRGDLYAGGSSYAGFGTDPSTGYWPSLGRADFNFRTYVSQPIPEPGSMWLIAAGALVVFGSAGIARRAPGGGKR